MKVAICLEPRGREGPRSRSAEPEQRWAGPLLARVSARAKACGAFLPRCSTERAFVFVSLEEEQTSAAIIRETEIGRIESVDIKIRVLDVDVDGFFFAEGEDHSRRD